MPDEPEVTAAEAFQPVLEHQIRCFQSAEENSRRHSARVGVLTAALFGFLGLAVFRLDYLVESAGGSILVLGFFVLSMALAIFASCYLFGVLGKTKGVPRVDESLYLTPDENDDIRGIAAEQLDAGCPRTGQEARQFFLSTKVHAHLIVATSALSLRNKGEKHRLDIAQVLVIFSVIGTVIALTIAVYNRPVKRDEKATPEVTIRQEVRHDTYYRTSNQGSPGDKESGQEGGNQPKRDAPASPEQLRKGN